MKLLIEVTLEKTDGVKCDPVDVFVALDESLDGETIYPQDPDSDEESSYDITSVILKEGK